MKSLKKIQRTIKRRISSIITSISKHNHKTHHKSKHSQIHVNITNRIILGMVNKERKKRHIPPVVFDRGLEVHALQWSKYISQRRHLEHSGHTLENVCMVMNKGSPVTITKNMYYCWRGSSPHWNWMMNPSIRKAGFGYSKNGKYAYGAYAFE